MTDIAETKGLNSALRQSMILLRSIANNAASQCRKINRIARVAAGHQPSAIAPTI
jgi:hypothetical protein